MRTDTFEKLLAMLGLQAANLTTYKTQVGATDADLTAVAQEAANMQYIADYAALFDADKKAITKIKQVVYNGNMDDDIVPFPIVPPAAPRSRSSPDVWNAPINATAASKPPTAIPKKSASRSASKAKIRSSRPIRSNRRSKLFPR